MLLFSCTVAFGQVKITGPNTAKPGKNVVLTLENKGNDMKIESLYNGEPIKDQIPEGSILMLKNLQDQPIIMLNVEKEGNYTFVVVSNIDNKTNTAIHVIKIESEKPKPNPNPDNTDDEKKPQPASDLATTLKAEYKKAPNPEKLAQLIQIFDEVSKLTYPNYDAMETVLQNTAKRYLQDSDLRSVRDAISSYLMKTLGDDSRKRTVDQGKAAYTEILKALRGL